MAKFHWDDDRHWAAEQIAAGWMNFGDIAEAIGVVPKTIYNWRQNEEFEGRVQELKELRRSEIHRTGLADTDNQIEYFNGVFSDLHKIRSERAKDAHKRKRRAIGENENENEEAKTPQGSDRDPVIGEETGWVTFGASDRPVVDLKLLKAMLLCGDYVNKLKGQTGKAESGLGMERFQNDVERIYGTGPAQTDPDAESE